MKKKQFNQILKNLENTYPVAKSELNFKNDFQLIISVILSAQCTDVKVNQVTPELFKNYPNYQRLSAARIPSIEKIIRQVNYYKTKAKNIKAMSKIMFNDHKSKLPLSFEELEALPGVGHKTASVVLAEKGVPALPVDTHVFRVSKRLGMSEGKDVKEVEEDLKSLFPENKWHSLHHRLIFHGRRVCKSQRPLCGECNLSKLCPEFKKQALK